MSGDSPPGASNRVFISYRREETAYAAGWLYDRLNEHFGDAQVFKDVDSIPLGDDFVEAITRAVGSCDVLLAVIGDRWVSITDERGQRRLDDPHDFVRLEIEAALSRRVRVIPVLVDDARLPRADEVPESLATLARRQALELSSSRFDSDTNRLVQVVASTLAEGEVDQPTTAPDQPTTAASVEPDDVATVAPAAATADARDADPATTAPADADLPRGPDADEATVPPPPRRPPVLAIAASAAAIVLAVVAVVVLIATNDDDGGGDTSTPAGGIEVDDSTVQSADGFELSGLRVEVRNDPPLVGDTITVDYSLRNVTDAPIELDMTFVGARNPDDDNRDPEDMNEGAVVAPGETIDAQGRVYLDSAGTWMVWPCYQLAGGQQCPDEWQVITFSVR